MQTVFQGGLAKLIVLLPFKVCSLFQNSKDNDVKENNNSKKYYFETELRKNIEKDEDQIRTAHSGPKML